MTYSPARRKGKFVLIGLTGMSGSGKSYSALLLARGLVGPKGKIALLDTENGRGSLNEGLTPYDVQELYPPFTPANYRTAIEEAVAAEYNALIIDSGSHEWEGTGGVLEMADAGTTASGKQRTGLDKWNKPKTAHKRFVNAMLEARLHVILCLRGKEKLVQVTGPKGKEEIVSAGVQPIQDSRVIYEMTVSLILDEETQTPTIRRCPDELRAAFPKGEKINQRCGEIIAKWVGGAVKPNESAEKVRNTARDMASLGRERFLEWYKNVSKPDRALLQPIMEELKTTADDADGAPEESPDDPFGDTEPEPEPEDDNGAGLDDGWPGPKPERGPEDLIGSG